MSYNETKLRKDENVFNRMLQVRMVKGSRTAETTEGNEVDYDEILAAVKTVVVGTGFVALQVVASYVALDTVRQIAVNRLSK